jgi:hypothetical protein
MIFIRLYVVATPGHSVSVLETVVKYLGLAMV